MEDDRAVYVKNSTRLKTDKRWLPGYTHERDIAHLRPPQGSRPTSAVGDKSDKDRSYCSDQRRESNAADGDGDGMTPQADSGRQGDGYGIDGGRNGVGMDVEGQEEEEEGRGMPPTIAIPSAAMFSQQQPQPSKQSLLGGHKRERAQERNERDRRHSQG